MADMRIAARQYTREHGDDLPEVRDWVATHDARKLAGQTSIAATAATGGDDE